ncbi:mercuric transporter MerT family protein [Caenimonas aquaedulcis]|uniref:Mercuric transport protein MerT n=1 Tax=Caenimonas aquaedulcis TaxID=2793270 RepID=A0A931H356_9BURK|nr:mercuric transporter MerT family protein [Caenimonas aquaedulcis]MBG9387701.1 mercuric transport protein [Caenimonas aquaedulcis]
MPEPSARNTTRPLAIAGIAALLASTCCVVPLVFALVGVSGAWIAHLRRMEPYSGALTALAAVALMTAGWRLYGAQRRAAVACEDPATCGPAKTAARWMFWVLVGLTLLPIVAQYTAHYFYD